MSDIWIVIVVVGALTIALKAVGPVLLGGRPLPQHLTGNRRAFSPPRSWPPSSSRRCSAGTRRSSSTRGSSGSALPSSRCFSVRRYWWS